MRGHGGVAIAGFVFVAALGGQQTLGHGARTANVERAPAAASGGWSGTITLTRKTEGTTPGPGGITFTGGLDQRLVITLNEDGTARATETYREEVYALKSGCGAMEGPHDVTTGTSDVQLPYYPQPIKYGDRFRIEIRIDPFNASRSFRGWIFTGEGCGGNATTSTRSVAQHTFTIEGDAPRGAMTLQGSEPPRQIGSCGKSASDVLPGAFQNWNNCGTETIAWSLQRSKKLEITKFELLDRDPKYDTGDNLGRKGPEFSPLKFLSASKHPFGSISQYGTDIHGYTQIFGTLVVEGARGDIIRDVVLEVLEDGQVKASTTLPRFPEHLEVTHPSVPGGFIALPQFYEQFDETARGERSSTEGSAKGSTLFEFGDDLGNVDQTKEGKLTLRVRVVSDWDEAVSSGVQVTKLVSYTDDNRYLSRDDSYGGDSWVRPSVKPALEHFAKKFKRITKKQLLYGDMANMHGGRFAPHLDHEDGLDADAAYDGYYRKAKRGEGVCTDVYTVKVKKRVKKKVKKGKKTVFEWETVTVEEKRRYDVPCDRLVTVEAAFHLIRIFLNDPTYGSEIKNIFVTFHTDPRSPWGKQNPRTAKDHFFEAIRNVKLRDGRMARDVIKHAAGHDGHFHLRFKEP
jgi:hypothetical protein